MASQTLSAANRTDTMFFLTFFDMTDPFEVGAAGSGRPQPATVLRLGIILL
jgi:hypothetical protein